jgi:hypothetical protein
MYAGLHVMYPFLSDFIVTFISLTYLKKNKYQISWKFNKWEPSCYIQMDRQIIVMEFRKHATSELNHISQQTETVG